mgnify:CR=1 FL=1
MYGLATASYGNEPLRHVDLFRTETTASCCPGVRLSEAAATEGYAAAPEPEGGWQAFPRCGSSASMNRALESGHGGLREAGAPYVADSAGWKWVKCAATPQRLPNLYTVWYGSVFDVDAEMRQPQPQP